LIESLIAPDAQQQNYAQLTKDIVVTDLQQNSLTQRLNTLSRKLSDYQLRKQKLTNLEQQQQALEQKAQAARSTYETLLKKAQELGISKNESRTNIRIIDPALPPTEPLNKKRLIILVFGVLLGVLSASITLLILKYRDRTPSGRNEDFKAVRNLQLLFPYPLLGTIPHSNRMNVFGHSVDKESDASITERKSSDLFLGEYYHAILSKILSLRSQQNLKSILITSAIANEGKSFTAANLAAIMAFTGQKVLLIDAHLNQPSQHLIWQAPNHIGLANLLEDNVLRLNEVQMSFSNTFLVNLDVLTSGKLGSNYIPQSSFDRVSADLRSITSRYDFVLIDAPPILPTSDRIIFALEKIVDGILLVANSEALNVEQINNVCEVLEQNKPEVIGVVINSVISKQELEKSFNDMKGNLYINKEKANISANSNCSSQKKSSYSTIT
jgi:polysaccharide biosynthesis transport protein